MDIKIEEATATRLQAIAGITGMDIDILATHIIRDGLARIDQGGGFSISTKDGTIKYGNAVPQAVRPAPVVQHTDIDPMSGMHVREINMRG